MSDDKEDNSNYLPRGVSPKTSLSRISRDRSASAGELGAGSSHSSAPSTRLSGLGGKVRPKRSASFKRTSVVQTTTLVSSAADLNLLDDVESITTSPRPRDAGTGVFRPPTTSTTNFVKNFLDDDDEMEKDNSGLSRTGLQFDADTQRNIHRSLLAPPGHVVGPGMTPQPSMRGGLGRSLRGRGGQAAQHPPPQSNLFQPRDDFYNVDQSVNLMDAEAGKYESKHGRSNQRGGNGNGPSSMVEIFLKETTTVPGAAGNGRRHGLFQRQSGGQANWHHLSRWEKCKEISARLLVPLFCCCVIAVVLLIIVLVYHNEESIGSAPSEEDDVVVNTNGMTETMAAIAQALVGWKVASPSAFDDPDSPASRALDWVASDEIALQAVPKTRRHLQETTTTQVEERLIQRYVLAVLHYSWNGITARVQDVSAAAMSNMDDLAGSVNGATMGSGPWLTAQSECRWMGVECHAHPSQIQTTGESTSSTNYGTSVGTQIRELNLTQYGVEGTLPAEITALTALVELDLRHNKLRGNLDALDWSKWKHLEYLLLGSNQLTGSLPDDWNYMVRIQDIDLGDNKFTGKIPAGTNGQVPMDDLENIFLDSNQLTGSIQESFLRDMPDLMYLDVTNNKLTGAIPDAIAELTDLRYFRAINNSLTGNLPMALGGMAHLDTLALDGNKFAGKIPDVFFSGMKHLRYLQLSSNAFSGPLPSTVGILTGLKNIHLESNQFTGTIPASWFEGEKALLSIRLCKNKLTGNIPASIADVAGILEDLRVSENELSGKLPEEIGGLSELRVCELNQNGFTGTIPNSWSGILQLEDLKLFGNSLTGTVPSSLCALEKQNEGSDLPVSITVGCNVTCDCCAKCV